MIIVYWSVLIYLHSKASEVFPVLEIGDVGIKKRIVFLLIWILFLSIFLGSHYHFCHYHSQTCSICSLGQPILILPSVTVTDGIEPPLLTSFFFPSVTLVPDYVSSIIPIKDRAPPIRS